MQVRSHKGFTLVELLAAISMTALLGLGVAVAAGNFTKRNVVELDIASSRVQLQKALTFISKDVRQAAYIYQENTTNVPPLTGGGVAGANPANERILALWKLRDGNLAANPPGCANARRFELRVYYYAPIPDNNFRGPNVIRMYRNDCPAVNPDANADGVLTANEANAWTSTTAIATNNAPILIDGIANPQVSGGVTTNGFTADVNPLGTQVTALGLRASVRNDDNTLIGSAQTEAAKQDLTVSSTISRRNF
jgi:prepilin-type N-terminal cleavage/methylation domain-containing protein